MTRTWISDHGFEIVQITDGDLERARRRFALEDPKYRGDYYGREDSDAPWVGYLGEDLFKAWLGHHGVEHTGPHPGSRPDFTSPGGTIDVKTLKSQYRPTRRFDHHVKKALHAKGKAEWYVFVKFHVPANRIVICGGIMADNFSRVCTEKPKGSISHGVVNRIDFLKCDTPDLVAPAELWRALKHAPFRPVEQPDLFGS